MLLDQVDQWRDMAQRSGLALQIAGPSKKERALSVAD
jgi:hypothetical protein